MQADQGQGPSSYLLQRWSYFMRCGMVRGLHALLVSDGYLLKDFFALLECHIEIEKCTNYFFADMDQIISATVVSHLDSNLCETGETPETVETVETLGSIFFRMKDDANM
jgi:hypothetical protein